MLDHALDWAGRGFRIFPLHPGTKRPVWKGWTNDATNDEERIRSIWTERDYNIGVLTDDLVVIDVDVKNGKDGFSTLLELGLPLDTLTVKTPSGGLHIYYKGKSVACSTEKLGEGLDVRSFHGYVLAPGSRVGDRFYVLGTDAGLCAVPPILLPLLDKPGERLPPIDVKLDEPGAVDHAERWLANHPPAVEGQGGDAHTFRTAAKLKDFGLSEDAARDLLTPWNARCDPPWSDADLRAKVANAYAYGRSPPGVESPQHQFAGVVLPPEPSRLARPWFKRDDDWAGSVEWLLPEVLPTTGVCVLTAPSNAGKTFAALDLAEAVALGRPWFGVTPDFTGGTALLVGEAYGSVKMRLQALQKGVPVWATYVGGLAARGAWAALREDLKAMVIEMQFEHGVPLRTIIMDTLSSSGILDDENDNAKAATVMKAFSELSVELGALFVILHHPPKSGDGERGAGAIRNNADYVIAIKREGTAAVREIEMNKSRDGETRALGTFTLVPVEIGKDAKGRPVKTMRLSPGEPKIKEAKPGVAYAALAIECVEWALGQESLRIEGQDWTPDTEAGSIFLERWEGKQNKATVLRTFNAAIRHAIDMGVVEALREGDKIYLRRKQL